MLNLTCTKITERDINHKIWELKENGQLKKITLELGSWVSVTTMSAGSWSFSELRAVEEEEEEEGEAETANWEGWNWREREGGLRQV